MAAAIKLYEVGRFQVVGVSAKAVKESARITLDYLRANANRVGLDRDLGVIPPELLDKVRVDFYDDPAQAAFKAMEEA